MCFLRHQYADFSRYGTFNTSRTQLLLTLATSVSIYNHDHPEPVLPEDFQTPVTWPVQGMQKSSSWRQAPPAKPPDLGNVFFFLNKPETRMLQTTYVSQILATENRTITAETFQKHRNAWGRQTTSKPLAWSVQLSCRGWSSAGRCCT